LQRISQTLLLQSLVAIVLCFLRRRLIEIWKFTNGNHSQDPVMWGKNRLVEIYVYYFTYGVSWALESWSIIIH
jgi:hypothetical protein